MHASRTQASNWTAAIARSPCLAAGACPPTENGHDLGMIAASQFQAPQPIALPLLPQAIKDLLAEERQEHRDIQQGF
jgi:hypothetical protein